LNTRAKKTVGKLSLSSDETTGGSPWRIIVLYSVTCYNT
jgi:hypothetical protein